MDEEDEYIEAEDTTVKMNLKECLRSYKLYGLLISTFFIIGTSYAFMKSIGGIKRSAGKTMYSDTLYDIFILSQNLSAVTCGLLVYFFRFSISKFVFGTTGAGFAIAGFLVCLIFRGLYVESIFIGISSGIWWVMAPIIVYEFFGPKPFAGVWGTVLTVNFFGMSLCTLLFGLIWYNIANPLVFVLIIFCLFSIIAVVALGYVLQKEYKDKNN